MLAVTPAVDCVANVIYHEARGMSVESQKLVGFVIMNRAQWKTERVCSTAYYPNQFSTGNDIHEPSAYRIALKVAYNIINKKYDDTSQGAQYFHTTNSNPYWARIKTYLFTLENHKYYR